MGRLLAVVLAVVGSLVIAGGLGFLAGLAPVFNWEMAGLVVGLMAAAAGALAGAAGAASGRAGVGAAVGVLLGGAAFLLNSIGHQQPPALLFWGTVTVAAAAGVAGAFGGILGSRAGVTSRPGA